MNSVRPNRRFPPLVAWGVAIPLSIITVAVSFSMFSMKAASEQKEKAFEMYNMARFDLDHEKYKDDPDSPPLITALGSSLVESAFPFDGFFDWGMRKYYKRESRFIRLAQMGQDISHFYPIFDRVIEAEPAAVFIEANLLMYDGRRGIESVWKRHRAHCRRMVFGSPRGIPVDDGPDETRRKRKTGSWHFNKVKEINTKEHGMFLSKWPQKTDHSEDKYSRVRRGQQLRYRGCMADLPEPLEEFLIKAEQRDIPVILLQITGPEKTWKALPEGMKACYSEWGSKLEQEYGASYAVFPRRYGLEYYRDFTHLNKKGRAVFVRWLVENFESTIWGESK